MKSNIGGGSGFLKGNTTHSSTHVVVKNNSYNNMSFFRGNRKKQELNITHTLISLSHHFNKIEKPFEKVLLTGVQHMLSTTVDMFSVFKQLGLEDAVVTGKSYSNHTPSINRFKKLGYDYVPEIEQLGYGRFNDSMIKAANQVWDKALNKIKKNKYDLLIAMDDGADLLLTTHPKLFNGLRNKPNAIIGIEQTRGGSNRPSFAGLPFPIINVAGSCIKNKIEYSAVAKVVSSKITALLKERIQPQLSRMPIIGVIGYGSMGKVVTERLLSEGFQVLVYDKKQAFSPSSSKALFYPEASLLIMSADIIVGCTGEDISAYNNALSALLFCQQKKWLISTGSKDTEFNKLLEIIQNETKQPGQTPNPLKDITYKNHAGGTIEIVRGGFPINFDNQAHSVPIEKIWPTRALLLLAGLMGINLYNTQNTVLQTAKVLMLDIHGQLAILREYQRLNPDDECLKPFHGLNDEEALEYIRDHSEGEMVDVNMTSTPVLKY